ncbi:MAG TPA: carboxyl transferase domain-containing protein, partial [Planctomycetota bacterium]|nr:carboxyl transferase domain-containing protein [Planctomycetota bacterium]
WWPKTPEKIERAQEMALRLRLPVVYLVDCSGLFLPEQSHTFPGRTGAGHIFQKNSKLSAAGVPQIAGVFGDCIAGGGYMPIISDRVFMTEQAYMVIAGAALIQGAKSQKLSSLDIGGPEVHVHQSGCADVRVPDDQVALTLIREEIQKLPTSGADFYRHGAEACPPLHPTAELNGLFPPDHRHVYDMEQVIARLVDHSMFWELWPERGREVIVGIARVGGLYMGFCANRQGLIDDAEREGQKKPAGILYREGIAKLAAFSRACNDDGVPIVWLQDISGFDIGVEAERLGLLGYGSSLIYSNSTNQVPMFTLLLRKASGAGYYAMAGLPYEPVVQLSTPITRQSVMEGRTLAIAAFNTKLDDQFEIAVSDPAERAAIAQGMADTEARIEGDMDPYKSASQMDTDEVVAPAELRAWLELFAETAYQSPGYRRLKNPRIWSLHDLAALAEPRRAKGRTSLEWLVVTQGDRFELQTPKAGLITELPRKGWALAPGQPAGVLLVLGQAVDLVLPAGIAGMVDGDPLREVRRPVGAGTTLLVLRPLGDALQAVETAQAGEHSGVLAIPSPQSGRFYQRPSPHDPAFLELGAILEAGMPVGLIEVMKTFAQVPFVPQGALPAKVRAVRWLVSDGADVEEGTPLLEVEPA